MTSSVARSCDVAVVGGGVIGLATAWRAAQRGLRVVVCERDLPGAATSAVAAGMLAPTAEAASTEPRLLELGLRSAELYPRFVAELASAADRDPGFLACGTLLAARDRDEAENLDRELALRRRLGLEVRRLLPSAARQLEPALAPTLRLALSIPGDHVIEPARLLTALLGALAAAGGELRTHTEVAALEIDGDRMRGVVLADGERLTAEHVVLAAGVWSDQIAGVPASVAVPLHPVKGQIIRLRDPAGPGLLTRVLRMPGRYIAPRGDGRYVVGATMEERGFDTTLTAGALYELLRDASELLPGVSELIVEGAVAGLRPATPDNVPAIGPSGIPGLHWAVGHYRGGILLAPLTAEIVTAGLTGASPPGAAALADPARFARAPVSA